MIRCNRGRLWIGYKSRENYCYFAIANLNNKDHFFIIWGCTCKHFGNIGENIPVNIFLYLILLNAVRMSSAQKAILYGRLYGRD